MVKPCEKCSTKREFTDKEKQIMNDLIKPYGKQYDFTGKHTYDIVGCKHCNYTGYFDRIAVFEICEVTEPIRELIANGESSLKIRDAALKENYRPLFVDALDKVYNGMLTLEEVNNKLLIYN